MSGTVEEDCQPQTRIGHNPFNQRRVGGRGTIQSLSGKSMRCKESHLPIRALLSYGLIEKPVTDDKTITTSANDTPKIIPNAEATPGGAASRLPTTK